MVVDFVVQRQVSSTTAVEPEKDAASFPAMSWIAAFVVDEFTVGAVYDTAMSLVDVIAVASVKMTVLPLTTAEVIVTGSLPSNTV